MDELRFEGTICTGKGQHTTLVVPGKRALPDAPADWPEELYPGSLNVVVDRYPDEFRLRGLENSVTELDRGCFVPAFEIPRSQILNNLLCPRPGVPRGGDAQVWRATLFVPTAERTLECWVLRRFGSRVGEQLECVAGHRLRDSGLEDGDRIRVVVCGMWSDDQRPLR
jgi:CTP-dependent riboflavin kinase